MTTQELIEKYLNFFRQRQHAVIPSASLVPDNDPSVLFTTAGMHPLVPHLLGQPHPQGRRLADVQQCVRTGDINEVGDDTHLTFFEMLGNWSLGDYFKDEAIKWSWEFLTAPEWLAIPRELISVSVFAGDQDAALDEESKAAWRRLGIPEQRIRALSKADNWWGPAGQTGPCGPDTEMFYWTGQSAPPQVFDPADKRWVEIWNDVFMQYRKTETGSFEPLTQQNVDTGMGVERTVAVLNRQTNVYSTDTFVPAFELLESRIAKRDERALRIVVDHLRAATMILGDPAGVVPSNVERGYVVRRLIRRAIRYGRLLGIPGMFTAEVGALFVPTFQGRYPWLKRNAGFIREQFSAEEERFSGTIERGTRKLERRLENSGDKVLPGIEAFDLLQTYGFPIELTEEILRERGWTVERESFTTAFRQHQELSRTAAAGRFRSGLADTSVETTKLHTATHLLHAALRKVLGEHVQQKGSNITPERLRFDFSYQSKLTAEELKRVEDVVNEQIKRALLVSRDEMSPAEATRDGALGFFGHKYTGKISVYTMGDFSKEICTGPHVHNTSELGSFHILKEEASSAGIRRIKAVVRPAKEVQT
ncbi:MAG: alanyl-tRNA synthetase [Parcubacteria group bacterium Gr01-1014_31]|nr:MAG: alanyl-tRNA synthetase [Parcubacteria group bacterium Gr01-1014_31]